MPKKKKIIRRLKTKPVPPFCPTHKQNPQPPCSKPEPCEECQAENVDLNVDPEVKT